MGKYWRTTRDGKRVRTPEGVRHEHEAFQSSEKARKDNSARHKARRTAIKAGIIKAGSSKDIHHKSGNPRDNRLSNLRAESAHVNRGHNEKSRKRGARHKWRG